MEQAQQTMSQAAALATVHAGCQLCLAFGDDWELMEYLDGTQLMTPGFEYRLTFHEPNAKALQSLVLRGKRAAWRGHYVIEIQAALPAPEGGRHAFLMMLNRMAIMGRLSGDKPNEEVDRIELGNLVQLAYAPPGGDYRNAAYFLFPIPLAHIARRPFK